MPIPIAVENERKRVADALEEMARLVLRIMADPHAAPPRASLGAIADRLERADMLLRTGIEGGGVKPAQIRSIASQFEAVARELRKGERRRAVARTAKTAKKPARRTATRTTTRKPARRTARRRSGGR